MTCYPTSVLCPVTLHTSTKWILSGHEDESKWSSETERKSERRYVFVVTGAKTDFAHAYNHHVT